MPVKNADIDIHEPRLARSRLEKSEQRLAMELESSNLGTWGWDIATDSLRFDPRCAQGFGSRRERPGPHGLPPRISHRLARRRHPLGPGIGRAYYDAGTGQPTPMAGTVANIDERKTQEERSERVVQDAGLGHWYSDLAAGRQRHLPRAARPSAQGVMTRDRVRERIHPEDVARMDEATRRSSSTASSSTSPPSTSSRSPCARRCRRRTSHTRRGSW